MKISEKDIKKFETLIEKIAESHKRTAEKYGMIAKIIDTVYMYYYWYIEAPLRRSKLTMIYYVILLLIKLRFRIRICNYNMHILRMLRWRFHIDLADGVFTFKDLLISIRATYRAYKKQKKESRKF